MKLSPPASSSDLEAAREIAHRLHQRRRRGDQGFAPDEDAEPSSAPASAPSPAPRARLRLEPPPRPVVERPVPPPVPPPVIRPAPPPPPPVSRPVPPPVAAAPPSMATPPPWRPEPPPPPDEEEVSVPSGAEMEVDVDEPELEAPPAIDDAEVEEPEAEVAVETPDVDEEDEEPAEEEHGVSPDELVGEAVPPPFEAEEDEAFEVPAEPPPIEIEDAGGDGVLDALAPPDAGSPFDEIEAAPPPEDDPFAEPPPPSWDDIIAECLKVSQASGAMLVDPAGQVFAAHGAWPEPGADPIAAKLVSMMDRTLKDAPTRSVSAPLAGQQLTAWRVPLSEGLVTVAFIARSAVRADLRPAIDAEIRRGAGA